MAYWPLRSDEQHTTVFPLFKLGIRRGAIGAGADLAALLHADTGDWSGESCLTALDVASLLRCRRELGPVLGLTGCRGCTAASNWSAGAWELGGPGRSLTSSPLEGQIALVT